MHAHQPFAKRVAHWMLFGFGTLSFSTFSNADLGTVRLIDPSTLPQVGNEVTEIEEPRPSSALPSSSPSTLQFTPPIYSVEQPWILDTPAGPTAYTLDRYQFELAASFPRLQQMLKMSDLFYGIRFGLTNTITLEGSLGAGAVMIGPRLNLSNKGDWTTSIFPWVGFALNKNNSGDGYSYSSDNHNSPLGVHLLVSRLIDDEHKFHFTFEGGRNLKESSYSSTYSYTSDSGNLNTSTYRGYYSVDSIAFRLSGAYELRIHRNHGLVFWVAPELISKTSKSTYASLSSDTTSSSDSDNSTLEIGIKVGAGYQYLTKHFGASIGISLGPSLEKNQYSSTGNGSGSDYSSSYSSFSLQGALTGSFLYRL